jgi:hypothetical protein
VSRGPDGRYGYQDPAKWRDPVPVTCYGCRAAITGGFHRRHKLGPFGRFAADLCDGCVPKRSFENVTACVCEWCGRTFTIVYAGHAARCCTPICGRRARRQWRQDLPSPLTLCATCHEPFTPKRADACYCSGACRQKSYRNRAAGRAAGREHAARMISEHNDRLMRSG